MSQLWSRRGGGGGSLLFLCCPHDVQENFSDLFNLICLLTDPLTVETIGALISAAIPHFLQQIQSRPRSVRGLDSAFLKF